MNFKNPIACVLPLIAMSGCAEPQHAAESVQLVPDEVCYFRAQFDEERTAVFEEAEATTTWLLSRVVRVGGRFPAFGEEPIMYLAAECGLPNLAVEQDIPVSIEEVEVETYDQAATEFMQREFGWE
mgnify:CR=1 FL=1